MLASPIGNTFYSQTGTCAIACWCEKGFGGLAISFYSNEVIVGAAMN
jgi:hypothetical protein